MIRITGLLLIVSFHSPVPVHENRAVAPALPILSAPYEASHRLSSLHERLFKEISNLQTLSASA